MTESLTMKKLILIPFILAFIAVGVNNVQHIKLERKSLDIQLNQKEIELIELNKQLEEQKNSKEKSDEKVRELEEHKKKLEADLQAKLKREKEEAIAKAKLEKASEQAVGTGTAYAVTGSVEDWLRASGIPQDQWWAVHSIVSRESGWNPNAVNPSSGACGLGQQLPCGKWAGAWNDPVAALKAQYKYVTERYGGYPQAVAFWNANHWY